jgi:CubicO group peptidase (beta-lactamase class C family)
MLVKGGVLNGTRLLSPRTIDLMASNHVGDLYTGVRRNAKGMGFGLAIDVVLDHVTAGRRASSGSFGWGGAFETYFWVDRKEQLTIIAMNGSGGLTEGAELTESENARRQRALASELRSRGLVFVDGVGQHPSNGWPGEPSMLVFGLTLDAARTLGTRLEQNAGVWSGADAVPHLILLR